MKKMTICLLALVCASCAGTPFLSTIPEKGCESQHRDAKREVENAHWSLNTRLRAESAIAVYHECIARKHDIEAEKASSDSDKTWACAEGHSCR